MGADLTDIIAGKPSTPDPKPAIERIENLAQRIIGGDIILPKFQRGFVWDRGQIIELLDSIYKNYPIGSILLWLSREDLKSERGIADLEIKERPREYPVNYLLDGQQRLSTICGALNWDGVNADSPWNVIFDLRQEAFQHRDDTGDLPIHLMRLNLIRDPARFFARVAAIETSQEQDRDQLQSRATTLFNRFKDYQIATVTLREMSVASVAPIFERINSTGTQLTIVDLMRAATWSPKFDLIDEIDDKVLSALTAKGFHNIDRKTVLRNLSAAAGKGYDASSIDSLRNCDVEELQAASRRTVKAYRRAVDFLVTQLKVPNSKIVPYANQIVVLADVFQRIDKPTKSQVDALKRWFWRSSLSGYFGGWNTGQMASDLALVSAFSARKNPDLDPGFSKPRLESWVSRQFRLNTAHAKVLALMLTHNQPRDLVTGQAVTLDDALAWENAREYHHIFPDAYLKEKYSRDQRSALANFALISSASNKTISDKAPAEYFLELKSTLGQDFDAVMESNLISKDAVDAALENDFDAFIWERAETLQSFALTLCGWG